MDFDEPFRLKLRDTSLNASFADPEKVCDCLPRRKAPSHRNRGRIVRKVIDCIRDTIGVIRKLKSDSRVMLNGGESERYFLFP